MAVPVVSQEFVYDHQVMISIAEACWREHNPSYSWHVLDWVCWKLRYKYIPIRKCDTLITIIGNC